MFDIKDYVKNNIEKNYLPIEFKKELIADGKRLYSEQKIRLDLFPEFDGDSILDFGCNTGFLLKKLKQEHSAGLCVGIDLDPYLVELANLISYYEEIKDLVYFGLNIFNGDQIPKHEDVIFDHSLALSITSAKDLYYGITLPKVLDKLKERTKKSIFVEPTNHEGNSVENLKKFYSEFLSRWGNPEFLGITDYQNRVMFRVHIS